MKKKNLKDNKIPSSKNKSKKKKDIPHENQSNPLGLSGRNQVINESTGILQKTDTKTMIPEEPFTYNSNFFSKASSNQRFHESCAMNTNEFLNFHCVYCNLSFPSKAKLQSHCLTNEHQSIIISDEGRDWKYRPPPRGILANEYSLCQSYLDKSVCRFGDQCIQAHADKELSEWKERFEYRSMKLEKAKERELHGASYADKLLEKLNNSQNMKMLLSEKVEGVSYSVNSNVNLCISQKPSNHTWIITLHCPYQIHAIALLHDSHRNHFSITNITMINSKKHIHRSFKLKNTQEWINPELEATENVIMEFKVEIYFETEIYGTLRQAVVIDFGIEPALIQNFCVDIVPLDEFKELESARTTVITHSERWCHENTDIINFEPVKKTQDDIFNDRLLDIYPPPTNKNVSLNQASLEKHPTKNNYRNRMHDLLNYEEMAQFDLISHFNIKSYLHLTKSYLIMPYSVSVANYALAGELYAKLDLSSEVSEDSPQGRLILNNCNSVLITKTDSSDPKSAVKERRAYEALLEAKTKKEIYIRLSKQIVSDLGLQPDMEAPLDIQFQLNRLPFCEMHYSLDHLSSYEFLFPNTVSEPVIPWSPSIQWNESGEIKLNLKQKEALVAITAKTTLRLPPILIIGPFGTGKTFTLGQAINQVIQQPDTYILICTHSNSAADIYIRDYLHPQYQSGLLDSKPLRIYYHRRRMATVHSTIHQYCLFEMKDGEQRFRLPSKEQIMEHRIVVTTINTSVIFAQLGVPKGHFTHILIDEAAQVMECSTLIPLSIANASTRIVLAGDYMQLSTEVFSSVCRERNLHTSLLERLYDLYPTDYPCKIMLVENYRSHPAIIKFTSTFFYEGRLKPRGKISAHPRYHPLTFFTARGEDVQDANSTAYYNNSEVLEVCERVMEVCKSWPVKLWGPLNEENIGVVSPYLDQVMRIRAELRKKKLYKVSVERVLNVQGKEFRVVILSTVRTRHTCSGNDSSLDYGFLSNAKLLTTAITRAQSLVAVVGDPISLCSLGKCRKLWEEFLRQCSEAGSLYGITWASLRSQLDGIELRKIYGLNPLAQEFTPRYLLLSTVPHPMAILPPAPPIQYFPYGRHFTYSPNVFPGLPVSYPANPTGGFYPPTTSFNAPISVAKAAESQKVPQMNPVSTINPVSQVTPINPIAPLNPYTGIPFQSMGGVYPNRAALVPFAPSPPVAHFPTIAAQNFFPTPTTNLAIHPAYIQPPSLGVYSTGALPYQPKMSVYPSVIPARPPPGFNTSHPVNNSLIERGRPKLAPQPQTAMVNSAHLAPKIPPPPPPQDARSASPDKSIQFLNNVHFPRERSLTPSWNDSLPPKAEVKPEPEIIPVVQEQPQSQLNSEPFMGENFVEEISKLLNEPSPMKPKAKAAPPQPSSSHAFKNYNHMSVFDNCPYQRSSPSQHDFEHDSPPRGPPPNLVRDSLPPKSFLTLHEVEKAMHSTSDRSAESMQRSVNHSLINSFGMQHHQQISSAPRLSSASQSKSLFTDSLKWNSVNSPPANAFALSSLFRSGGSVGGGGASNNIPLYMRKGTAGMGTDAASHSRSDGIAGSHLGTSSGWAADTVKSHNEAKRSSSRDSSTNQDFSLASSLLHMERRERESPFLAKTFDQAEGNKTYAGVLRSALDPNGETI